MRHRTSLKTKDPEPNPLLCRVLQLGFLLEAFYKLGMLLGVSEK